MFGPLRTLATDETLNVMSRFAAKQVMTLEVKFPSLWEKFFPDVWEDGGVWDGAKFLNWKNIASS